MVSAWPASRVEPPMQNLTGSPTIFSEVLLGSANSAISIPSLAKTVAVPFDSTPNPCSSLYTVLSVTQVRVLWSDELGFFGHCERIPCKQNSSLGSQNEYLKKLRNGDGSGTSSRGMDVKHNCLSDK
ncbi:hypothetical protein F0562_031849 [Nyssa sinensis]|uniref:Uncharacterized protein n=1 Tax=Nyssa sinensis TaxID=561372 RepID=A0A5J5AVJ2_9ASTE|nr:hypothetical protein F0562_031849 [Nyssa sinensis]